METRDGDEKGMQQGAQKHAEGQQGEKTHARFLEQIHQPLDRSEEDEELGDSDENGRRDGQRG
jgi:hypothetical protein